MGSIYCLPVRTVVVVSFCSGLLPALISSLVFHCPVSRAVIYTCAQEIRMEVFISTLLSLCAGVNDMMENLILLSLVEIPPFFTAGGKFSLVEHYRLMLGCLLPLAIADCCTEITPLSLASLLAFPSKFITRGNIGPDSAQIRVVMRLMVCRSCRPREIS